MKSSYLKKYWIDFFSDKYSDKEWLVQKIFFAYLAWEFARDILFGYQAIPFPQSICHLIDCTLFFTFAVGFKWIILVLLICYILEKKMLIVTLTLAILLCLLGLIEDSNGFQARTELMGIIFFVQFLAYSKYFNPKNLPKNRVQFSVQVIAASYVISALSKMQDSRLMWVSDAQYLPVQILRSIHINEVTYPEYSEWYSLVVDWMLLHPNVVTFLISTALLLELFAFIAIFSKRNAFVWGILLICMHIGINYSMSIVLKFIAYPMAIFFSNIYYFLGLIIFSVLVLFKNALLSLFLQTKTLITKN